MQLDRNVSLKCLEIEKKCNAKLNDFRCFTFLCYFHAFLCTDYKMQLHFLNGISYFWVH